LLDGTDGGRSNEANAVILNLDKPLKHSPIFKERPWLTPLVKMLLSRRRGSLGPFGKEVNAAKEICFFAAEKEADY